MKFIPAIDLKDNKCVRLLKGNEKDLTVFNNNPVKQAKFFEHNGCERIHVVDLDGAFGRPNINKNTILKIRNAINIPIELGGGIKDKNDVSFWINEGIDFLVIGSLAVNNIELVLKCAEKFKNKIYVALDVIKNKIMIKGWLEDSNLKINDVFKYYNNSSIKGYILTDISRDGLLQGLDLNLINSHISLTTKPLIVGGGLSNYEDLKKLKHISNINLEGVIAGKSFYSGNIKINKALEILNGDA